VANLHSGFLERLVKLRIKIAIERGRKLSLILGATSFSALFLCYAVIGEKITEGYLLEYILFWILYSFNSWFWTVAILGFGRKYLNYRSDLLMYLNEGVLPIYILHMPLLVIVGFYIDRLDLGIAAKLPMIIVFTFVGILLSYDLLVRRIRPVRFLFGMKPRKSKKRY
jgi:hypothetical protein